jgi:hypothetical protein
MTLYPVEKSIRILNRWARKKSTRWELHSNTTWLGANVKVVGDFFDGDCCFYGRTERQALHKAAKYVEGVK